MQWRRFLIALMALLAVAGGLSGLMTAARASSQATFGPPTEKSKVILNETSIDGPAIMTAYTPQTVLAWTGTDPAHHLNVLISNDGVHYSQKLILPETSLWRPAIAFIDSGRGAPYGTIVLAWTGTDPAHTLNLAFIATPSLTVREKITFWGDTSFTAPAAATINGDINSDVYLAWAGNDSAHTLHILHHATYPEKNETYTLTGKNSISRPNLSTDMSSGSTNALILSWTGVNNHIYFANSADRVHWTMPSTSPLARQSAWAPSMIAFFAVSSMPTYWLAWTGTGTTTTRHLSVQYTQHYPSWNDAGSTTTLDETAISSPELAYNGTVRQVLIAWAGTDTYHHLNVAIVSITG